MTFAVVATLAAIADGWPRTSTLAATRLDQSASQPMADPLLLLAMTYTKYPQACKALMAFISAGDFAFTAGHDLLRLRGTAATPQAARRVRLELLGHAFDRRISTSTRPSHWRLAASL
jgi:hypothetical protein